MEFAFFPGARLGAEEVTAATDHHPGVDAVAVAEVLELFFALTTVVLRCDNGDENKKVVEKGCKKALH